MFWFFMAAFILYHAYIYKTDLIIKGYILWYEKMILVFLLLLDIGVFYFYHQDTYSIWIVKIAVLIYVLIFTLMVSKGLRKAGYYRHYHTIPWEEIEKVEIEEKEKYILLEFNERYPLRIHPKDLNYTKEWIEVFLNKGDIKTTI